MRTIAFKLVVVLILASLLVPTLAVAQTRMDAGGAEQSAAPAGPSAVAYAPQTGVARLVRLTAAQGTRLARMVGNRGATPAHADAFFATYGTLMGVQDAASELVLAGTITDALGYTHLTYNQVYQGLPVFGAVLRVHFDARGLIYAVNGIFVPNINVNVRPQISARDAIRTANRMGRFVVNNTLLVYRENLAKGETGRNFLAYEVEVNNGRTLHESVYVDAQSGKILDRISHIYDGLDRKVYSQYFDAASLIWEEGDPLPFTGTDTVTDPAVIYDANRVIEYAEDTYNMVAAASGGTYLSYDGQDATMHSIVDSAMIDCPNAQWTGSYTHYCVGITGDDTVAHEWGHAYTEYTHNLIYAWQPGAINEAYSDIFGEVVDLINGSGLDDPGGLRTDGACSLYTAPPPVLRVNSPESIAADYAAGVAQFGPAIDGTLSGNLMIVDDGSEDPTLACQPLVNDLTGQIAFIRRGTCTFAEKVKVAQDAGAIGAIIANHEDGGDSLITMSGDDATITIQSLFIGYTDGNLIEPLIADGVNVTFALASIGIEPDDSYRWLSGEDDPGFGGAIRDMWNPTCYGDPDKVTSENYYCGELDNGGVHYNSGVANHGFALATDGGSFNGIDITGLGLTKAFQIYWRAESVYQVPTTGFAEHADALELSCLDLRGVDLLDLNSGTTSGEVIVDADCAELAKVIAAVELRQDPLCPFAPLLDPNTPALCTTETEPFYSESFDADPGETWALSNLGVFAEYVGRDWVWSDELPADASGGFFGEDSLFIGDCTPGSDDQSGVMYLDSPVLTVPAGEGQERAAIAFDHYVATEFQWDGGNVWISVNGGEWEQVKSSNFRFNAYNSSLLGLESDGNTNPLAGLEAFTGSDGGEVWGSWGQSQVDISSFAGPGDTFQLRFALGVDGCNGLDGWYLDKVEAYFCELPPPMYHHRHRTNIQKPG